MLSQWGTVEAWLAGSEARGIVMSSGVQGLRVTAIDPTRGERIEFVARDEDPSKAAMRAIARLDEGEA